MCKQHKIFHFHVNTSPFFFPPKSLSPVEEIRQDRNNRRWREKNTVRALETQDLGGFRERRGDGHRALAGRRGVGE